MKQPLMNLAYVSSSTRPLDTSDLMEILAVSRYNNARDEITGFLMFADRNFFQFVEGPQIVIDELYFRLMKDTRHTGLIKMLYETNTKRLFSRWSMAFRKYDSIASAPLEGYSDFLSHYAQESLDGLGLSDCKEAEKVRKMITRMRANCLGVV